MLFEFPQPLIKGRLVKRYKRFLADIELDNGQLVTAHCTNSGSMASCIEPGAPVMVSPVTDPNRKTRFTWEMIFINNHWVGINTVWPNMLAAIMVGQQLFKPLAGYQTVKREVTFGDSRFDLQARNNNETCYIEVKNVTMRNGNMALFPDARTERGQKHLNTLMAVKDAGFRAVMLYIVQRSDVEAFAPANAIDPHYAETLVKAMQHGVEVFVVQVNVSPQGFEFGQQLPVVMSYQA